MAKWHIRFWYDRKGVAGQRCSEPFDTCVEAYRKAQFAWEQRESFRLEHGVTLWGFEVYRCDEQHTVNEPLVDKLLTACEAMER